MQAVLLSGGSGDHLASKIIQVTADVSLETLPGSYISVLRVKCS